MLELLGTSSEEVDLHKNDAFLGEVPNANLITPQDLSTAIGLSTGLIFNTTEPWLKFSYGAKILFIAKKAFRYRLSWDSLIRLDLVTGGKIITIGNSQYRVRLLKGAEKDPSDWTTAMGQNDPEIVRSSEWNRLIYRIHANNSSPDKWASYTNTQLGIAAGQGRMTICQERIASIANFVIARGNANELQLNYIRNTDGASSSSFDHYGWRPVLELVN